MILSKYYQASIRKTNRDIDLLELATAEQIMHNIRIDLMKKYDVSNPNSEHFKFKGLCNEASIMLINAIKTTFNSCGEDQYTVESIHGELAHIPEIESKYWPMQHTMVHLYKDTYEIYIDPTCDQFSDICPGITFGYIGWDIPKWFLPDENNWLWKSPFNKINNNWKIKRKIEFDNQEIYVKSPILDHIVYDIWGHISDKLRKNR